MQNSDIKFLAKPVIFLIIVIVGLLMAINFGIAKISGIRDEIETASEIKRQLATKALVLSEIQSIIPTDMEWVNLALPDSNASLFAMSQIRSLAQEKGLTVANLGSAGGADDDKEEVSKFMLTFEVSGEQGRIYELLDEVTRSLPIMNVENVKLLGDGGSAVADVSIGVYSSRLPTKIPSITTPVTELTDTELELVNQLANYRSVDFFTLTPNYDYTQSDPETGESVKRESPFD